MSKTISKMFRIRNLINESSTPLTTEQISEMLDIGLRTVQRHAITLANERLVGFKCIEFKREYDYTYKATGKVIQVNRNSFGYAYFKLEGVV